MARIESVVNVITDAGLITTGEWTSFGGAGDTVKFANNAGKEAVNCVFLLIKAPAAGAVVTIETSYAVDDLDLEDRTITLLANEYVVVGPFQRSVFNQAAPDAGYVYVASDTAATSVIAFSK